jgi:hypothetical protein
VKTILQSNEKSSRAVVEEHLVKISTHVVESSTICLLCGGNSLAALSNYIFN